MDAGQRRSRIVHELQHAQAPLSGGALAKAVGVSRQVIVQDIALLRAGGCRIVATNRGYLIDPDSPLSCERELKVHHRVDQTRDELETIVDLGGVVVDVSVNHRVYGKITAPLGIRSRRDVARFVDDMESGRSSLLMTVTSGYHFHRVSAESEEVLDDIAAALEAKGYLAAYLPHEQGSSSLRVQGSAGGARLRINQDFPPCVSQETTVYFSVVSNDITSVKPSC